MTLNASARRPTSSLRAARTRRDRSPPATASAAAVRSDSGVVMRQLMTQASSAPSTTKSVPIGSIAFQKVCAGPSATDSGVSAQMASGVFATRTSVPSHFDPSARWNVTTSPGAAAGGASTRLPRSVQIPDAREPRRSALPTPIRRAMDWPAVGEAARRRKTRKPRRPGVRPVGGAFTSATCSV